MRGNLKRYFHPVPSPGRQVRRGKSQENLKARDGKLCARFYFYAQIKNDNYTRVIEQLAREFDISERVVTIRLRANEEFLDKLFLDKPTIHQLKQTLPYFSFA